MKVKRSKRSKEFERVSEILKSKKYLDGLFKCTRVTKEDIAQMAKHLINRKKMKKTSKVSEISEVLKKEEETRERITSELEDIKKEMKTAEKNNDEEKIDSLVERFRKVSDEISEINGREYLSDI